MDYKELKTQFVLGKVVQLYRNFVMGYSETFRIDGKGIKIKKSTWEKALQLLPLSSVMKEREWLRFEVIEYELYQGEKNESFSQKE